MFCNIYFTNQPTFSLTFIVYSTKPFLFYLNIAFLKRNLKNKNGRKTGHLRPVKASTLYISLYSRNYRHAIFKYQNTSKYSFLLHHVKPVIYDFIKSMFITTNMAGHLSLKHKQTMIVCLNVII